MEYVVIWENIPYIVPAGNRKSRINNDIGYRSGNSNI